jgi:hypothetical protein
MRRLIVLLLLVLVGCGDDPPEAFDTYQLCFNKVNESNGQRVLDSIVECCIEHPIAGVAPVCKDTVADCINYLTANLNQMDASTVDVMNACAAYIQDRGL